MRWDDVNARARGLATHLLSRADLERLTEVRAWDEFVARLLQAGYPVAEAGQLPAGPDAFARVTGLVAARRHLLLARWLGSRRQVLTIIHEDEERRTLRVLLRGAVQGTSAHARLRAAVPTPGLPAALLERLAHTDSPAALARGLLRAGHPAGRVLETARSDRGGLHQLEAALGQLFAVRATRAARRGGALVRTFTALRLDAENAGALLHRGNWGSDVTPEEVFLPGGRWLDRETFDRLAAGEAERLPQDLGRCFGPSPLAGAFAADALDPVHLEDRVLAAMLDWLRRDARRDPLGPAVLLSVLLRIQVERHDLRATAAGLGLGAPSSVIRAHLVSR